MLKIIRVLPLMLLPSFVLANPPILFKPPTSGAPSTQMGGGTRGLGNSSIDIQALAPTQLSLTSQASPDLYWYISQAAPNNIEFSLSAETTGEIIIEQTLPTVTKAGIQTIKLTDLNAQLEVGKVYLWSIALVIDPANRAKDILISTAIRRETTPIDLNDVAQLAQAGFWYDTLHYLTEKNPAQINELLKQAGITLGGH